MSTHGHRASKFVRNALQRTPNHVTDPFIGKIEDKIYNLGQYVLQRKGIEFYNELVNHIWSENSK